MGRVPGEQIKKQPEKCNCLEKCSCQDLGKGHLNLTKAEENFAQMILLAADVIFGNGENSPILNPKQSISPEGEKR